MQQTVKKRPMGFTLVELIVVITILVILGSISFLSFLGYVASARDGSRVSDLANLTQSFDTTYVRVSSYPLPETSISVTYSGWVVWNQGTVGEATIRTISEGIKISKKPTDPLFNTEYTYSVTSDKKEYQLAWVLEWGPQAYSIIPQTYAESQPVALIKGNYNGVLASTLVGDTCTSLALPSIILADTSVTELKSMGSNVLVFNRKTNLPASYKNNNLSMTGGFSFDVTNPNIVVHAGLTSLNTCAPKTQLEAEGIFQNIQLAYSGTDVQNESPYKELISETGSDAATHAVVLVNGHMNTRIPLPAPTAVGPVPVPVPGACVPGPRNPWLLTIGSTSGSIGNTLDGPLAVFWGLSKAGITTDAGGNLYVSTGNSVMKYSSTGQFLMKIGWATGNNNLDGTSATFGSTESLAVDSVGNIYIADSVYHRVKKYSSTGVYITSIGSTTGASGNNTLNGTSAQLSSPGMIAVDGSDNIYISETSQKNKKYSSTGAYLGQLAGIPRIQAVKGSTVYGLNAGNVESYTSAGVLIGSVNIAWSVQYIAVDSSWNIYAAAGGADSTVYIYNSTGTLLSIIWWGDGTVNNSWQDTNDGGVCAGLSDTYGVAVDNSGNVYVVDSDSTDHYKVKKYGN